jgi:hypothetical protein
MSDTTKAAVSDDAERRTHDAISVHGVRLVRSVRLQPDPIFAGPDRPAEGGHYMTLST